MFDTQFLAFGTFYLLLDSCTQYSFDLSSKSCHYRDFDGFCAQRQGLERSPLLLHLSEPLPPWTPAGRETQKPEPSTGVPDVMLAELWEGFPWYHIYILLDAIRINYVHFLPRKLLKHPDPTTNWFHFETQDENSVEFSLLNFIFPSFSFKTWFCIALEIWFCIVVLLTTLSASSAVTLVVLLPLMNSQVEN